MMTSSEVAQMMAAQNQMFMGQGAYAQSIGPMGHGHTPYSYAPNMFSGGMQSGNRFAGGVMSAMGGAANIAGAGLGVAGMFGALGKIGGAAVDPFSMFGLARGMGMGMMGSLGMAALPLAGGMLAAHTVGSFVQGGQQQSMINNTLGQNFQFANMGARGGMGFSRQDMSSIGGAIRELSHVPELMTSMEELTKMLPKLKSMGVMQGVRDAGEFNRRFREAIGTIRDMSKILGTTMEEASEFFAQSRGAGFFGKQAQLQNVLNARFTAGTTGMSMPQVMQMQQSGANFATAMGTKRSLGATAVTNMAQTIARAQAQGAIGEGQLEDMTGLQGPEAIQAASERMTQAMVNFSTSSPVGRLLMAGLAKFDESGKAVGFDEKLVRQLQSGAIGVDDLKRRAGSLTNDQKISFTHRAATLSMSLAGQVGAGGVADIFQNLLGGKGTDADRLMMSRHTGLNENEVDLAMSLSGMGMGDKAGMGQFAKSQAQEAAIRERTDPKAIMKRLGTRLHSSTFGHVEEAGAKVFNAIGKAYDDFIDDLVGRAVVSLSKEGADKLAAAMSGGDRGELEKMFKAAHGMTGAGAARQKFGIADAGLVASDIMTFGAGQLLSGATGRQGGEWGRMAQAFRDTDVSAFFMRGSSDTGRTDAAQMERAAALLGGTDANLGKAINAGMFRTSEGDAGRDLYRKLTADIEGFRGMDNKRKMDEVVSALQGKIAGGTGIGIRSYEDLTMMAGGEDRIDQYLSRISGTEGGQQAAQILQAAVAARKKGYKGDFLAGAAATMQGGYEEGSETQVDFSDLMPGMSDFLDVEKSAKRLKAAEKTLRGVGGIFFGDLSDESVGSIMQSSGGRQALMALNDPSKKEAVRKALSLKDDAAIAELKKLGIDVKPGDIKGIKDASDKITAMDEGDQKKAFGAIGEFETARQAQDWQVIAGAFTGAAGDLRAGAKRVSGDASSVTGLAEAFEKFSKTGKMGDIDAAAQKYLEAISGAKGDRRAELIEAGGSYGADAAQVLSQTRGLKGAAGKGEAGVRAYLAKMGIKDDATVANVLGDSMKDSKLTDDELKGIQGRIFGLRAAGSTAQAGQGKVATVEDKMLSTLQSLDKTMALTATIIASSNRGVSDELKGKAEQAYKESQNPQTAPK